MEVESTSTVDPGTEQQEAAKHPKPKSLHDAFFKQTFGDARLAGIFLRERLPEYWASMFASVDPVLCEAEFIEDDRTKSFADKVLGLPPLLYIILEGKVWATWLDIMQVGGYCFAILNRWYRQVVRHRRKELKEPPAPALIAMLVHSGPKRYNYATELAQLQGLAKLASHQRAGSAVTVTTVLVDLRTIEDDQLSKDPILCARLRALKYAGEGKLRKNSELLDRVLKGVDQLPEPHCSDILGYLQELLGRDLIEASLKRVAPEKVEDIMVTTRETLKAELRAEINSQVLEAEARGKAKAEAAAAQELARLNEVARQAKAEMAKAKAEARAEMAKAKAEARAEMTKAKAKAEEAEAQAQSAKALLVAAAELHGVLSVEVRERIAAANLAQVNGWLSDIVLKKNLDSLLGTAADDGGTSTNGSGDHPDAPANGAKKD